ncbi:hypothetical protein K5549_015363 [Capra hircus]|nr:hypothetical protein K5549_015363 [Capra hircus]
MESGTEDRYPHSPSMEQPTDQTPSQQDSFEKKSSDVEEKLSEGKGEIVSSQLQQNSVEERGSGSEPEMDEKENLKENETQDRKRRTAPSDSERGSSSESSRKRKMDSRDRTCDRTGRILLLGLEVCEEKTGDLSSAWLSNGWASPDEPSVTSENKKRKVLDKQPRSRSPEDQVPPLRKSLVTSLRYMSEAIYQSIVHVHKQPGYSPQCWQRLAQLRGPLWAAAQTTYAMANQAAYAFPAEGWLSPAPAQGTPGLTKDGEEGPSSEASPPLP